jgi:hypothetical protein
MKVTATKCLNGKRHKWKDVEMHLSYGTRNDTSWCKRCGCMTEFFKTERMKKRERCFEDGWNKEGEREKRYHIEIPEHLEE